MEPSNRVIGLDAKLALERLYKCLKEIKVQGPGLPNPLAGLRAYDGRKDHMGLAISQSLGLDLPGGRLSLIERVDKG